METKNIFFLNAVADTMLNNKILLPEDFVLIGVSGGADSIALLNVMIELQEQIPIKIGIAHLNHNLRGDESKRDRDFVQAVAEKLDITFHLAELNVKRYQEKHRLSLEDAARQLRYKFFRKTADENGYNKIATGHTANDNAELVLMNLLRGTGTAGLSGIPVMRGKIVRPLIEMNRNDVLQYLQLKKIDYVTDSSNTSRAFLRNKIRLDLLPLIEKNYNINIIESLNRTSRIIKEDEEWIEKIIVPLYNDTVSSENDKSISLSVQSLDKLPLAPKRRILRKAIEHIKGDLKKITLLHTDTVIGLLSNPKIRLSVDLPDQIQAQKKDGVLILTKHDEKLRELKPNEVIFNYSVNSLNSSVTTVSIPEISKKLIFTILDNSNCIDFKKEKPSIAWINYNSLTFPLTIRNTQSKDRFVPFGMTGSQTLKKFFSGSSIPIDDKKNCPLLVSNNDIVWIGGYRLHNSYKINKKTKKILKIELLLD